MTAVAAARIEVDPVVARMAGPAEDHAAAEITADADHVGTMISAAGEPRVVRVAHVTTAMTDRAGTMDRGVRVALVLNAMTGPVGMIARVTTGMSVALLAGTIARVEMTGLVETIATVTTGMSVALLAVTIARAEMIDRAEIRDRAAVSGTVQHRPHRSVRAIRIRSVPSRSK